MTKEYFYPEKPTRNPGQPRMIEQHRDDGERPHPVQPLQVRERRVAGPPRSAGSPLLPRRREQARHDFSGKTRRAVLSWFLW